MLSLALGVSACETIREHGGDGACIRWVNDILLHGKKIARISHRGAQGGEMGGGISAHGPSALTSITAISLK